MYHSGLISFLLALPKLIELMTRLGDWLNSNKGWINELETQIDRLERASNSAEKRDAARALTDSIRNFQ